MRRLSLSILAIAFLCSFAFAASDDIQSSVTNVTPSAIVTPNGQGAVSPGQISILYTVVANQFTAGYFGSFTLNAQDIESAGGNGKLPTYPTTLSLTQTGSTQVVLTPATTSFTVSGAGWAGSTTVSIYIPVEAVNNNTTDGSTLVGNLNASAGSHLGTNTSVQVKIKLVVPKATTCLNVYNFATDQDFTQILSSVQVNVNKKNNIVATNPGQLSDNLLVVNTCGTTENFDAKVVLDSHWQTNPSNNPGNAVFTYNTAGEIDETSFNIAAFGTGTPQGENACVQNISVAAGDSFLLTVHSGIINQSASTLTSTSFYFGAGLYTANSGCAGTLDTMAGPNPAGYTLPFTTF